MTAVCERAARLGRLRAAPASRRLARRTAASNACGRLPVPDPRTLHRRAILFMVVAATCWSSGGFLVRQLSITNAWEIVFWRSLFMALFVVGVLVALHGRRDAARRRRPPDGPASSPARSSPARSSSSSRR